MSESDQIPVQSLPESEQSPQSSPPLQLEISSNLHSARMILAIQAQALQAGPKSRERSLLITKLHEARMWAEEGIRVEANTDTQIVEARPAPANN